MGFQREKSNFVIAILKNYHFDRVQIFRILGAPIIFSSTADFLTCLTVYHSLDIVKIQLIVILDVHEIYTFIEQTV